jgi:hypothetical protein
VAEYLKGCGALGGAAGWCINQSNFHAAYPSDGFWEKERIFSGSFRGWRMEARILVLKSVLSVIAVRPTVSDLRCFRTSSSGCDRAIRRRTPDVRPSDPQDAGAEPADADIAKAQRAGRRLVAGNRGGASGCHNP